MPERKSCSGWLVLGWGDGGMKYFTGSRLQCWDDAVGEYYSIDN